MKTWNTSDHAVVPLGGRTMVFLRPHGGAYGYGHTIEAIVRSALIARRLGAALCLVPGLTDVDRIRFASEQVSVRAFGLAEGLVWRLRSAWRQFAGGGFRPVVLLWRIADAISTASMDPARPKRTRGRLKTLARTIRERIPNQLDRGRQIMHLATANNAPRLTEDDWRELGERPLDLRLSPDANREAERLARAAGIPIDGPIVAIHVRHLGYRTTLGLRERRIDVTRAASIETYLPAMDLLTTRGLTVVRLGDPDMPPVTRPGVVDLAHSPHRQKLLDVWVTLNSRFFVLCDSGPALLPRLAAVPTLAINVVDLRTAAIKPIDRFICKRVMDSNGTPLKLTAMIDVGVLGAAEARAADSQPHRSGLMNADVYDYVDNTPDEIMMAVEDMLNVVDGHAAETPEQIRLHELLVARAAGSLMGQGRACAFFAAAAFAPNPINPSEVPRTNKSESLLHHG